LAAVDVRKEQPAPLRRRCWPGPLAGVLLSLPLIRGYRLQAETFTRRAFWTHGDPWGPMLVHASPCESMRVHAWWAARAPKSHAGGACSLSSGGKSNAPLCAGKRWADPNSSTVQRGLMARLFRVQDSKCAVRPVPRQYSPHPVCPPPISADQPWSGWGVCVCMYVCVCVCLSLCVCAALLQRSCEA
jgi:hypothetical protein